MKRGSSSKAFSLAVLTVVLSLALGCAANQPGDVMREVSVIRAVYCETAIQLDGRLDEATWKLAPVYALSRSCDQPRAEGFEAGRIRACWNQDYLYVAVEFEDTDIVAESPEAETHHYRFGDVAELFLKPVDSTCYWEMHATPRSYHTTFFYPSYGRLGLPSSVDEHSGLRVAATVDGTVGNWSDRDRGWSVEFAIPVSDLARCTDVPWGTGTAWTVLVGRYNYGRYNEECELTSSPTLPVTDFHKRDWYAVLSLELPEAGRDE